MIYLPTSVTSQQPTTANRIYRCMINSMCGNPEVWIYCYYGLLKYNTVGANDSRAFGFSLFSFYYRLVCARLCLRFAIIVLEFIIPTGVWSLKLSMIANDLEHENIKREREEELRKSCLLSEFVRFQFTLKIIIWILF